MEEEGKKRMVKEIKEWLARYYREFKGMSLSEKELNKVFGDWCMNNNLTKLI
jgi:hypothetical protein